ncbi:EAL domain-containing protein [Vibrio fortis]|uniref:cyclic-guanylate-specific phosphodiesterase n=1 Tax=Vibrio fortis TaxID=212667 RepID=A0A5N3S2S5_9VIBR|nr:EAL domain-containing protein [Vibrio fortis]KAB0300211.1 EAL domain-containing protein [Vibrio fortis]
MFDIFLEVIGAILATVIFYTIYCGTRHPLIQNQPGIKQITIGFGLLLLSSFIDITDNFPTLNFLVIIGDTELEAFIEKAVGTTLGLLFLSSGFRLWLPSIHELVNTRQSLNILTIELDERVQRRSIELERSNNNLKIEILERKKIEKQLKHQALHDALTMLPNRSALIDFLELEISSPDNHDSISALFFLDLDNFKQINDLLGHQLGDSVLEITAKRLNGLSLTKNRFIGRLGGDEFVLVMTDIHPDPHFAKELVTKMAQQVISALDRPIYLYEHKLKASCSIGIKLFSSKSQEIVSDLLRQADIALYDAKGKTKIKGGFSFFHEDMQSIMIERVNLAREIHDALERKQFYLHYQPQVSSDGQVFGLEALLRWDHPTRDIIGPDEFIPIAEEAGLIDKLGRYVLHNALSECSAFFANQVLATKLKIAVNISPSHFLQIDFVNQVKEIMDSFELKNCHLVLEITESVLIQNIDEISEKMEQLHKLGVGISLDDFGTGYSSLSYVQRLPFDTIKIDRSFIRDINTNSNDAAIVDAILAVTASLGVSVIAEGVETREQQDFLEQRGCENYQGYLFGRPTFLIDCSQILNLNITDSA